MAQHALPPCCSHFELRHLPATPWLNGGGLTRQIASSNEGVTCPWVWRVSVADIVQDGPFSVFANTDRQAILASGRSLQLHSDIRELQFDTIGDTHTFPGEMALKAVFDIYITTITRTVHFRAIHVWMKTSR